MPDRSFGPYSWIYRGVPSDGQIRSESTENALASRDLARTPPVTVFGDFLGGFSQQRAEQNALIDAIRAYALKRKIQTGDY